MSINFHVTGKERKALVEALSEITFSEAAYAGAPTFAYRVGDYTVDKNGVIFYPPTLAQEAVALVVEKLKERGFIPEGEAQADLPEEDAPAEIPAERPDVAPETAAPAQPEAEAMEAAEGAKRPDMAEEGEADPAKTDETDDAPGYPKIFPMMRTTLKRNPKFLPSAAMMLRMAQRRMFLLPRQRITSSPSAFRAKPLRTMRWND